MFTLIKNANLYAPAYLGKTDILLCGEKIAHISKTIELNESFCHTIDVQGKIVTPGFIDQHVHITGGGGQQGYAFISPRGDYERTGGMWYYYCIGYAWY